MIDIFTYKQVIGLAPAGARAGALQALPPEVVKASLGLLRGDVRSVARCAAAARALRELSAPLLRCSYACLRCGAGLFHPRELCGAARPHPGLFCDGAALGIRRWPPERMGGLAAVPATAEEMKDPRFLRALGAALAQLHSEDPRAQQLSARPARGASFPPGLEVQRLSCSGCGLYVGEGAAPDALRDLPGGAFVCGAYVRKEGWGAAFVRGAYVGTCIYIYIYVYIYIYI